MKKCGEVEGLPAFWNKRDKWFFEKGRVESVAVSLQENNRGTSQEREYYSTASAMPSSKMANVHSFSGNEGESYTLQIRFWPRPFFKYSLKKYHTISDVLSYLHRSFRFDTPT